MLQILAPAVVAAQGLLAMLAWQQARLPGRRELAVCLVTGGVFFLYKAFPHAMALSLPVVLAAPLIVNRAYVAALEVSARPLWTDILALAVLLAAGIAGYVFHIRWAEILFTVLSFCLFIELPVVVWRGLPDDLIEARRNIRLWVLGLGGLLGALVAIGAVMGQGLLAVTMSAVATLGLCATAVICGPAILATLVPARVEPTALDQRERAVLLRLRDLMDQDHLYTDPALTLSRLAQRLDLPEHRLRRVIHHGEDCRNFSAYLNGLRIAAVKARIESEETLLTLALAAGYTSLSVFNRAFREAEGMTPSAFRAARIAKTKAKTMNRLDADKAAGKA